VIPRPSQGLDSYSAFLPDKERGGYARRKVCESRNGHP